MEEASEGNPSAEGVPRGNAKRLASSNSTLPVPFPPPNRAFTAPKNTHSFIVSLNSPERRAMPRDKKLPEIELKKPDLRTPLREKAAQRLLDHWPINYTDLEKEYQGEDEPSADSYRDVYDEHMGPPDDDLTVEEIRAQYGSVTEYLEARKRGEVDLNRKHMTERELDMYKEGFKEGYREGLEDRSES